MARLMLIVSAILLVLSLGGLIGVRGIPGEVKQEVSLLNYEQQGRFDYSVRLKPSYLFGPSPQPAQPNALYPAQIVNSIDFVFGFSPTTPGAVSASADLLLENPGLWAKRIELAPSASINGTATIGFSLDIAKIQVLFAMMEEEVKTASSPRQATVRATVRTADQTLVLGLPVSLTDTVIEIDPGLVQTGPAGTGRFRYGVNLKPNSIFETPRIESPPPQAAQAATVLRPGQPVFGKLVDTMNATFDYQLTSDKAPGVVSSQVKVAAVLEATKLWSKEFVLFTGTRQDNFKISFPVDVGSYLALLDTIRNETGAPAEGYTLTLTATVRSAASTGFGNIDKVFTQTLKGTLKDNVLQWDNELTKKDPGAIKQTRTVANSQKYLGLPVGGLKILTVVLAIIFGLFLVFSVVLFFEVRPAKVSAVEQEADRIWKKYGQRMAGGRSRGATLELDSMEDLAKVADELGKPILHEAPETADGQHTYFVVDGFTVYRFRLPER